ncbi:MAG: fibrillarin-like rRNA/tRNA 2'-O-methyltransferase [Methanomicrobiales archaeon]|jgi:fibrillarin-like pre-rRNA processing protein|nr:fibrillarin-like rRNA/tRNA 2'-O-methyltransferase [Methanomicrobiales archaeon]
MIWDTGMLLSPGTPILRERIWKGKRIWDPKHSKLSALYHKLYQKENTPELELTPKMRVLYLGAGSGTTVSFVADYVEVIYAIEPAPEPMTDLISIAQKRKNIIPLLSDARKPKEYAALIEEVDMVYQDVAQPNQVEIFLENCEIFLKSGGIGILMLKTRCIDVRQDPQELSSAAAQTLSDAGYIICDRIWLEPWHRDHSALVTHK